jgi:hypothetical protein
LVNAGSLINTGGLGNAGTAFIGGVLTVTDATDSSNKDDGAIHTDGGLGVTKAAFIGTTLGVGGITTIADGTTSAGVGSGACGARHTHLPVSDRWGVLDVLASGEGGLGTWAYAAVWLGSGQNINSEYWFGPWLGMLRALVRVAGERRVAD